MILKVYLIIFLYVSLNTAVNIRSDGYCLLISSSYSCPIEYPVECVYYTCSKNRVLCDKYFMFKIFLNFDNLENRQMKHFQSRIIKCKINKNNRPSLKSGPDGSADDPADGFSKIRTGPFLT